MYLVRIDCDDADAKNHEHCELGNERPHGSNPRANDEPVDDDVEGYKRRCRDGRNHFATNFRPSRMRLAD